MANSSSYIAPNSRIATLPERDAQSNSGPAAGVQQVTNLDTVVLQAGGRTRNGNLI